MEREAEQACCYYVSNAKVNVLIAEIKIKRGQPTSGIRQVQYTKRIVESESIWLPRDRLQRLDSCISIVSFC